MSTPSGVVTASSISTTASVTSSVGSAPGGGNSVKSGPTGPSTAGGGGGPVDRDQIYQWILELASPETRETALLELSKKREVVPDLAPMLWHSYGTIAALLQEIIAIYPAINPPVLTAHQSNRVCNALGNLKFHIKNPDEKASPIFEFIFTTYLYVYLQHYSNAWPRIPKPDLFFFWLIFRCICTHSFTRLAKLVRLNISDLLALESLAP